MLAKGDFEALKCLFPLSLYRIVLPSGDELFVRFLTSNFSRVSAIKRKGKTRDEEDSLQ